MPDCFTHFVNMAVSGTKIFSQGSVATYARHGGIFNNHAIANFLENLRVKFFKKSVNV